jgi:hypothetical protein
VFVGFRGTLNKHRTTIASALALAVATAGVLVYAMSADGYRAHDARLNDGGIWVTNSHSGFYGRINKPIGQLDGVVFADLAATLDIVQDGGAVVGVNSSDGLVAPIDPAEMRHPEGEQAGVPGGAQVALAGGTLAVTDPADGRVWAQRVIPGEVPAVSGLDAQSPPVATAGDDAALAVTSSGRVLVASAGEDTLTTLTPKGPGFDKNSQDLPGEVGESLTVTAVGDTAVVLDAGDLDVLGGGSADVPAESVLQQSGPGAGSVLVATGEALLEVDLGSGDVSTVVDGVSGRPSAPVRLGDCVYGGWSGGAGTVATVCGGGEPKVAQLDGSASDLVFRVNRGEIVLNDRASGRVWNIDSKEPTRMDNWEDFRTRIKKDDKDNEHEKEDQGDRRPPQAKPDRFGARPGRTTVLHPLDNDSAPRGRILAIRSVEEISGSDAEVTISPDGQTLQLSMPDDGAATTTFEYYIDDGRAEVSAHATVTVTPRPGSANAAPHLREGFEDRDWTVPAGGVLDVPVLPDWRDKEDGDPIIVASAEAVGGETSGAAARVTSSGRVRFTAPAKGGQVKVEYAVSDGIGDPVGNELTFLVQEPKAREAVAGVAEPDIVAGEVGKPITIRPLGNDLPGSDPVTPTARLTLGGKVAETGGARVRTDLPEGSITFTSDIARSYFLDYDAAYGNAPFAKGRIRVDVRAPQKPPPPPVAMPDTVTLRGQAATLVDVLANDVDPTGGMLVVQRAAARADNQLDVAVVDGRWLRLSARQGQLVPNPQVVRYFVSNGTRSGVQGEVVVTQAPRPADNAPVTETDRVTVRAGAGVAVPVLDNDFSPAGDTLSLVPDVAGEEPGQLTVLRPGDEKVPTGQAFVAGRLVRYVAPADLEDPQTFQVRYLATNAQGDTAPGRIEISVVPLDRPNQPPEPPVLEGRSVSGDTLKLKLPGSGVDPDGDSVTLLGLGSAPKLGRLVRFGANSMHYQAYPDSVGTDEFTYQVTDPFGEVATGTVRVAIVPPGPPQPPLAVDDSMTTEPGRHAIVDVLANDLIAAGDRVSVELVDPPEGVSLESDTGPLLIDAPGQVDGRNVEVVYSISNGIAESRGTVTLRTEKPYNNPPVVFDAFGDNEQGDSVTVDVLESAYDPDGSADDLEVTDVFAPVGVRASVDGGRVTVARGEQPIVVPFRVEDADGGAATASLYVPATGTGLPYVVADGTIRLDPGESKKLDLSDYVVNPAGGPVSFTLKDRIWASPEGRLTALVDDENTFTVQAGDGYMGPGAVTFEVTTGVSVDDPDAVRAVLAIPVQVGDPEPILRCPTDAVEVAQGETAELDISTLCHVWTADPEAADSLAFDAEWSQERDGLSIEADQRPVVQVAASGDVRPGTEAVLEVSAEGSEPGRITVRAVKSPPPSLAPIRIADMKAGQERTIDLARYLRPGVSHPEPTVVRAEQITGLDVRIARSGGSSVTITTGDKVDGRAEFRIVMSDVSGRTGLERQVEGLIALDVLDAPDQPRAPVPGRTVRSQEVHLEWRAPAANGAPITAYELKASNGTVHRCGSTSCDFTGLTNGRSYTFMVRALNAVGWSEWSPPSAKATPDAKPGTVGPIEMVSRGDGTLTLRWTPPTTQTSAIERYYVTWPGGSANPTAPRAVIRGLDNNKQYVFSVQAENALDVGPLRNSPPFQSIGTPAAPAAPDVTPTDPAADTTAVIVSWPAVDPPNGPGPVRYTVLRDGTPLPACTDILATQCENTGIAYDGTTYRYAVKVTNDNGAGNSATGPEKVWSAVGQPAPWGDWSVQPTGTDNQGRATFTSPASRGATATVKLLINGAPSGQSWSASRTGQQFNNVAVSMPSDGAVYNLSLQVCNEQTCGTPSQVRTLQTYGPVGVGNLGTTDTATRVECRWPVNPNGLRTTVYIGGSNRGTIGPGEGTQTVSYEKTGYDQSLDCDLRVVTEGGVRPDVTRSGPTLTTDPQPPTVTINQGAHCNDGNSLPDCNTGGGGIDCLHASCARIHISSSNVPSGSMSCTIHSEEDSNGWGSGTFNANSSYDTPRYYGYPGRWIYIRCTAGGQTFQSDSGWRWPSS